jgi:uncharacterized protein involved in exopolysaccharide biosynthesis
MTDRLQELTGAVARGWCHPETETKEMDVDLAEAIVDEVLPLLVRAEELDAPAYVAMAERMQTAEAEAAALRTEMSVVLSRAAAEKNLDAAIIEQLRAQVERLMAQRKRWWQRG